MRAPRIAAASLFIPSIWVLLALLPAADGAIVADVTAWSGIVITVVGFRYLIRVLLRVANPGSEHSVSARRRLEAAVAVIWAAVLAFVLGTQQSRFLSREDFAISGHSQPPGCTPGEGTLVRR